MKMRVGILTSGGDCPGLNATIRGVAKALYQRMGDKVEIIGILNGYDGLINGNYREMSPDEFSGILTVGGTILGTKRTPFKKMRVVEDDKVDKVAAMKKNYRAAKLDCLLCLGGNGTHKTANLLSQEGLNIIGLPKTIDNDIYGTDVTFGFHTAVDIATEVIDRIHTTAGSHSRVMCIEIMGNKAGWLTLYSGIAGGADIILLPELPYDIDRVCEAVERRAKKGSNFSILAVAEGAINTEEARMKRKDWMAKRAEAGLGTAPLISSAAASKNPARQALVAMTGPFWCTVVICLVSGLVIVSTLCAHPNLIADAGVSDGATLANAVFGTIPTIGTPVLMLGIICFAYSTILGWSYYGERVTLYLFGRRWVPLYIGLYICMGFLGGIGVGDIAWTATDISNALMAIPNIIMVLLCTGMVAKETQHYVYDGNIDEEDSHHAPTLEEKSAFLRNKA